jgi:hypothetical protein
MLDKVSFQLLTRLDPVVNSYKRKEFEQWAVTHSCCRKLAYLFFFSIEDGISLKGS